MSYQNHAANGNVFLRQQLLNTLHRLWFEHVMWTRFFLISTAFDLPDLDLVTKRLLRNPTDFAAVLKTFYPGTKADQFEQLFTEHLLIAAQLVNAAKRGDQKTAEEERSKWYDNATKISALLQEINPYWNQSKWQKLFFHHLSMTENEAGQILSGMYADSIATYDMVQEEAMAMADEMAMGIFKQFGM